MSELVFFYGTLMTGFDRRRRLGMDEQLRFRGRGWITGALFDLGLYPAAIPAAEGRVFGEVFEVDAPEAVLAALDQIEGYQPSAPDASLYVRRLVPVNFEDAPAAEAWAYFYNAPLGRAPRISSGDYLAYLKVK
jgi:gamma-glutamylcyclotransferase (GGCT)/AIG2-like uncharacterized protein YtfP